MLLAHPAPAQSTKLFLPETNSTITLSFTRDEQFHEDYRSIVFNSGGIKTRIVAHEQIIRIPAARAERKAAFIWSADAPGLKIDPSRFFLVGHYTADEKPHTLLFFLSDAAASNAPPLLILGFSNDGKPSKLFERRYDLISFEQTNGGALITVKPASQGLCIAAGPYAPSSATYDPYSIFLFTPGSKAIYQLAASRAYNLKHYVWMGPTASEKLAVISNLPGHPKMYGVTAAENGRLLAQVECQ